MWKKLQKKRLNVVMILLTKTKLLYFVDSKAKICEETRGLKNNDLYTYKTQFTALSLRKTSNNKSMV